MNKKRSDYSLLFFLLPILLIISCSNPVSIPPLQPLSDNSNLSDMSVSDGTLVPSFSTSTLAYTVNVENSVSSITVSGTTADSNATVSYDPAQPSSLVVGANTILVTVTAEDGVTTKDYEITVNRADPNTDLGALSVSDGTLVPSFSTSTLAYTVNVENSVSSITVSGTTADSNATVSYDPAQPSSLVVGANTILVTVTAEDGVTTKDYEITVNRADPNTDLGALSVSDGTLVPSFSTSTLAYMVNVENSVSSITVSGTTADSNATVSYDPAQPSSLVVGVNTILVTVTAEDGVTTKDYEITVNRAKSTNVELGTMDISVGSLIPTFSTSTLAYTVNVENSVSSITVSGTTADSNATVSYDPAQPSSLVVGANTILVTVTAEDGVTTRDYSISVFRYGDEYISPTIGTMKYVPAGVFQRDGSSGANTSGVSSFLIGEFEVTRAQFLAIMGYDGSQEVASSGENDPVQTLGWAATLRFCNKLSSIEGLTPVYVVDGVDIEVILASGNVDWDAVEADWSANGYRLPTEMEWMWAAMGAQKGSGYSGGVFTTGWSKPFAGSDGINFIGDYVVFGANTTEIGSVTTWSTLPVGSRLPNELGIYDLSGNVSEWTWDRYGTYPAGAIIDYRGPSTGTDRTSRGGDYFRSATNCTIANRSDTGPNVSGSNLGFRVVRQTTE